MVSMKGPMSAAVITEFAALFRLYLARTSNGKEATLKFAIGLYGVMGTGPVPVPAGVAGVPGDVVAGAVVGKGVVNLLKLINVMSSGLKPSSWKHRL